MHVMFTSRQLVNGQISVRLSVLTPLVGIGTIHILHCRRMSLLVVMVERISSKSFSTYTVDAEHVFLPDAKALGMTEAAPHSQLYHPDGVAPEYKLYSFLTQCYT
jgi:hypothetical protein